MFIPLKLDHISSLNVLDSVELIWVISCCFGIKIVAVFGSEWKFWERGLIGEDFCRFLMPFWEFPKQFWLFWSSVKAWTSRERPKRPFLSSNFIFKKFSLSKFHQNPQNCNCFEQFPMQTSDYFFYSVNCQLKRILFSLLLFYWFMKFLLANFFWKKDF